MEGTITPEERERRRAELLAELVHLAQEELPEPAQTLDELEALTERVHQEVAQHVLEELVQRQQDRSPPGEHACPQCQQRGQFNGRYPLEIVTTLGRLRVRRPYFYCSRCRHGYVPLDAAWRLGPANTSPAAQARVAFLAHSTPYSQLPASFRQLHRPIVWPMRASSCEEIAQTVGTAVERNPPAGPPATGRALVIQVDGVMFPTRGTPATAKRSAASSTSQIPRRTARRKPVPGCAKSIGEQCRIAPE